MNTKPHVHAMIVAAGRGSRFGASIPKQYVPINGQTLLQHSVARLACSSHIDNCLLVISAEDSTAQMLDFLLPVWFTIGGAERWQSVQLGVEAIIDRGADNDDLILIHDAARPAVPYDDIDKVIQAAKVELYGAILATPVADTLKESATQAAITDAKSLNESHQHSYAKRTIDRDGLWQAQTPQVFRIGQLRRVLTYVAEYNLKITDEASAFELLDLPIRIVTGSRQNIKLTYAADDILLSAILAAQSLDL